MIFFMGLCGVIAGSFANMLIYRLPNPMAFKQIWSFCPHCMQRLTFKDLIPIFSFIYLKGKCRYCKKPIGSRYLLVEIIATLIFIMTFHFSTGSVEWFKLSFYLMVLLCCFFIDIETYLLPFRLTLPLIIIGLGFAYFNHVFYSHLFAACTGFLLLWVIRFIASMIYKREAMGFGDLVLLAGMGSFWGLSTVVATFFLSSFIGGFFGLLLILLRKYKATDTIAFGPFLIVGNIISLFFRSSVEMLFPWLTVFHSLN